MLTLRIWIEVMKKFIMISIILKFSKIEYFPNSIDLFCSKESILVIFEKTHFVILLRPANDTKEGELFDIICPITQCAKIYGDVQFNGNTGKNIPHFTITEITKENKNNCFLFYVNLIFKDHFIIKLTTTYLTLHFLTKISLHAIVHHSFSTFGLY